MCYNNLIFIKKEINMQPFKRTTEKVLAWISNTLLFLFTGMLALIIFTGFGEEISKSPDFIKGFLSEAGSGATAADATTAVNLVLKLAFGVYIVLSVLALIATLTMKSRIVSGVLFILTALGVAFCSGLVFFPYIYNVLNRWNYAICKKRAGAIAV